MSSSSQAPQAVPVTQLGLSADEVSVLQHAQREAAAAGSSSSRAASRASSQGLLILDSSSLTQLGRHFDRLMQQISQQLDHLTEQSQIVTMAVYDEAGNLMDNCDVEIRRFHSIMAQIDDLEVEFDRIRHIRDIVRGYRQRVQEMERALESSQPSSSRHHSSSSRHGHSSHGQHSSSSSHRHHHGHRRERH
ncbi:hypothetical protein DHEL01_v203083 [Diaporthe helianthi]|uniref:Biogenesis of lysosome-related organelles complex 1 subunit CNL1 n=1 Tax=Diaporthe helianthi TaxID=158607 RepID=A0A2P5I7R0_DIAHE|nr:hypothetical protein DHEL01_v203083 [Diaporthe helianthi]